MKMINVIFLLFVMITFTACGNNNNNTAAGKQNNDAPSATTQIAKKYPIKSGIITFQRSGIIGSAEIIVYFDDYGKKERNEVYGKDGLINEVTMSDGVNMYKFTKESIAAKTVYIMGPGLHGTEMQFVADPFNNNEKRKARYEFIKLENIDLIDKDCEAYCVKSSGGKTTFAGWRGLLLYSKVQMAMGVMETVAVDFKENADVDPDLFKIPDGYKTEKM